MKKHKHKLNFWQSIKAISILAVGIYMIGICWNSIAPLFKWPLITFNQILNIILLISIIVFFAAKFYDIVRNNNKHGKFEDINAAPRRHLNASHKSTRKKFKQFS
jgi:glucan phosphoethanolaminetransferase (alkaline phosphatase superfamily)